MEKTYRILKLVILVLVLVAVLLGGRLLYQSLQDKVQLGGLVTQATAEPAQSPDSGAVPPEETQPETQPRNRFPILRCMTWMEMLTVSQISGASR